MKNSVWMQVVGVIVLAAITSVLTLRIVGTQPTQTPASQSSADTQNTIYDRVIASGTLKACYVVYPPSMIKDPNTGKLSGVSVDVLEQAAKNLGLKLSWDYEVNYGDMIEALNTNKCDVIGSALWGNSNRGKSTEFIEPLFYSPVVAYVRSNDSRFDTNITIANDKSYKLATIDGSTPQVIASKQFPDAETLQLPQGSDISLLLTNVAEGKADMTFVEPKIAVQYEKNNPGKLKPVVGAKPVAVYPDAFMVKKGEFELKSTLDGAVRELSYGGFISDVIDRYEKSFPGAFYKTLMPYSGPSAR